MFSYALQEGLVDDASTLQPRQKEQLKKRMLQVGFDAATEAGIDLADMVGGLGNPGRSHRGTHGGPEVIPEILGADAILKLAAFAERDTISEMQCICVSSWKEIVAAKAASDTKSALVPPKSVISAGGGGATNRLHQPSNRNTNNINTILPTRSGGGGVGGRRINPLTGQPPGGGGIVGRGAANQLPRHQIQSEVAFKRTIHTKIVVHDRQDALLKGKHAVNQLIEKANERALKEHERRKEAASQQGHHGGSHLSWKQNQLKGALRTAPMHRSLWTRAAKTEINLYYRRQNTLSTEALGDNRPADSDVSPSQKKKVTSAKNRHHRVDEFDYDDDDVNNEEDRDFGSEDSDSMTTSSTGSDTDDGDDYADESTTSDDGKLLHCDLHKNIRIRPGFTLSQECAGSRCEYSSEA
jgi:hypothetical protein